MFRYRRRSEITPPFLVLLSFLLSSETPTPHSFFGKRPQNVLTHYLRSQDPGLCRRGHRVVFKVAGWLLFDGLSMSSGFRLMRLRFRLGCGQITNPPYGNS